MKIFSWKLRDSNSDQLEGCANNSFYSCLNDQANIAWFTSTWGVYLKLVWISQHPYSSFLRSEETPLESWQPEFVLLHVFGHIMLKTPVLVRSLKLSSIEPCEYLDGWPPGNTRCWRQFCCVGFWTAMWVTQDNSFLLWLVDCLPKKSVLKEIISSQWCHPDTEIFSKRRKIYSICVDGWDIPLLECPRKQIYKNHASGEHSRWVEETVGKKLD